MKVTKICDIIHHMASSRPRPNTPARPRRVIESDAVGSARPATEPSRNEHEPLSAAEAAQLAVADRIVREDRVTPRALRYG